MKKLIALFLLASTPAIAATPCDGIWQKDKAQGMTLLRPLLTKNKITNLPARATVYEHMQLSGWNIVWGDFADAEPGGFVIHDKKLVANWGGSGPETAQELTQWMLKQTKTMPKPLAACFGWYVAVGRSTKAAWPNPFNR